MKLYDINSEGKLEVEVEEDEAGTGVITAVLICVVSWGLVVVGVLLTRTAGEEEEELGVVEIVREVEGKSSEAIEIREDVDVLTSEIPIAELEEDDRLEEDPTPLDDEEMVLLDAVRPEVDVELLIMAI